MAERVLFGSYGAMKEKVLCRQGYGMMENKVFHRQSYGVIEKKVLCGQSYGVRRIRYSADRVTV